MFPATVIQNGEPRNQKWLALEALPFTISTYALCIGTAKWRACKLTCAGNVLAASDFICKVPCEWGPQAMANTVQGPRRQLAEGIYMPPYTINNANNQVACSWLLQLQQLHSLHA